MLTTAIFSLTFLIIGMALGYLIGKGVNAHLPEVRPPQAISQALARHKEKITGYTGRVVPLSPKDLKERKETEALMKFEEENAG
jgi:hypothetical protein